MICALHPLCHFLVFVRFHVIQASWMVPQELLDVVCISRVVHLKIFHDPEQEITNFIVLTKVRYLEHA